MSDWLPDIEPMPRWHKVVLKCVVCKNDFMRQQKYNTTAVTCSPKCRRAHYRAKHRQYSEKWRAKHPEYIKQWRAKQMSSGKK